MSDEPEAGARNLAPVYGAGFFFPSNAQILLRVMSCVAAVSGECVLGLRAAYSRLISFTYLFTRRYLLFVYVYRKSTRHVYIAVG